MDCFAVSWLLCPFGRHNICPILPWTASQSHGSFAHSGGTISALFCLGLLRSLMAPLPIQALYIFRYYIILIPYHLWYYIHPYLSIPLLLSVSVKKLILYLQKHIHNLRVKETSTSFFNDFQAFFFAVSFLITPVSSQCVVNIHNNGNSCR